VSVATAPNADPRAFPTLSVHQKSAAMESLMRSATECIARSVSVDPRFKERNVDLGDLIVESMSHCVVQVRAMIDAYDRYFGEGEGEAFFRGPYPAVLPSAVSKWVRDAVKYPSRPGAKENGPHPEPIFLSAAPWAPAKLHRRSVRVTRTPLRHS